MNIQHFKSINMKNIITLLLLLFIITACTKKEEQKETANNNSSKEQTAKPVNNVYNISDNITDNISDNITQVKKFPEIEYIYKTTIDMSEKAVPLNKVDIEQLLSKYYQTDVIKKMRQLYETDPYKVLELSLEYGYFDIADELLKGVTLDVYLKNLIIGNTAKSGKIDNMKYLEKYNISINNDLNDAVMQVYKFGTNKFLAYKMVEYLLHNGADPNASDGLNTPLTYTWNKASLDLLLKYGADIEFIGYLGNNICGTYLLESALKGEKDKVDYLLSLDANPFLPAAWYKNKYTKAMKCYDVPNENIGSLYKLSVSDMELDKIDFDKNLISEYAESIKKYSKMYIIDVYANAAGDNLSDIPFSKQGNIVSAVDYTEQFVPGDIVKNNNMLSNIVMLSKDFHLYDNNKKVPYIYFLIKYDIDNTKYIHYPSYRAYISLLISNGFSMENENVNVLDYIFSTIYYRIEEDDYINFVSSYIYGAGQDKKDALKKLKDAFDKTGRLVEENGVAQYIYRMYDKYHK